MLTSSFICEANSEKRAIWLMHKNTKATRGIYRTDQKGFFFRPQCNTKSQQVFFFARFYTNQTFPWKDYEDDWFTPWWVSLTRATCIYKYCAYINLVPHHVSLWSLERYVSVNSIYFIFKTTCTWQCVCQQTRLQIWTGVCFVRWRDGQIQYIPRNMHTVLLCFALLWLCNRS